MEPWLASTVPKDGPNRGTRKGNWAGRRGSDRTLCRGLAPDDKIDVLYLIELLLGPAAIFMLVKERRASGWRTNRIIDQPRIKIRRATLIFVAGIISASCSEKPAPDREKDASEPSRELLRESEVETEKLQPGEDMIGEDCVGFVGSTKVVPARAASADCPGCPAGGTDVLAFRHMKTDSVSCSGDTCTVLVTIRAVFNPGAGETIVSPRSPWPFGSLVLACRRRSAASERPTLTSFLNSP